MERPRERLLDRLRSGRVELENEVANDNLVEPGTDESEKKRQRDQEPCNQRRKKDRVRLRTLYCLRQRVSKLDCGKRERDREHGAEHAPSAPTRPQPPAGDDNHPYRRIQPVAHVANRRQG